jgi:hypothetical protein
MYASRQRASRRLSISWGLLSPVSVDTRASLHDRQALHDLCVATT